MDKTKALIVSGEPRSGTSLMMQTLKHLGVETTGVTRIESADPMVANRSRTLNPKGYYEVAGVVKNGISAADIDTYKGKAVKIITSGLLKTTPSLIDKIILCLRDPSEVIESQKRLAGNIRIATKTGWTFGGEAMKTNPDIYIVNMGQLAIQAAADPALKNKILPIDYAVMMEKKPEVFTRITQFIEFQPEPDGVTAAMNNISTDLYRFHRSKDSVWSTPNGKMALDIYRAFLSGDPGSITARVSAVIETIKAEYVRWLDDAEFGTWMMMTPALYRAIIIKGDAFKKTLLGGHIISHGGLPVCKYYSPTGQDYTIKRPDDIGDLTRKKVVCGKDNSEKTIEACFHCKSSMGGKLWML